MSKNIMILLSLSLLVLPFIPNSTFAQQSTTKIPPTDDAFIVINANDPSDKRGLQSLNTGDYKFIKIGYAWDTTRFNEKIISAGVIKFDLADLKSANVTNVTKADLMMFPYIANLTGVAREVEVVPMANANWTESKITFRNAPPLTPIPVASASVSGAGTWVDWDITDFVKKNTGSEISLGIFFKTLYHGGQENLAFYSKEADNQAYAPYLQIAYPQTGAIASGLQSGQDYSLYVIAGGLAVAGVAFGIFLRNRGLQRSKPEVVAKTSTKKESGTSQTSNKEEPEAGQTSGKQGDELSETVQCKKCGKTILRQFKACPYCGNVREINFPL